MNEHRMKLILQPRKQQIARINQSNKTSYLYERLDD